MLLDAIRRLLHKATSPRSGNVTDLLNTHKQTQRIVQMRRWGNIFRVKEQDKTLGK